MRRLYTGWLTCLLVLAEAATVLAEEAGHGGEAAAPSLFSGGMVTSFLTLVIFVLLLAVLGKFAWGPLLSALKAREDRIRQDLDAAKSERQEAQKLLNQYKEQLAQAQAQAEETLHRAALQAEQVREKIAAQGQEQAKNMVEQARQQIEQAKNHAVRDLYVKSAQLAGSIAAKILGREVNMEDHRILIQQGLDDLHKNQ